MSTASSVAPFTIARSRFLRLPVLRSSITVTSSPRVTSASTRFEPMKPAPPVTSVFMRRRMLEGDRLGDSGERLGIQHGPARLGRIGGQPIGHPSLVACRDQAELGHMGLVVAKRMDQPRLGAARVEGALMDDADRAEVFGLLGPDLPD